MNPVRLFIERRIYGWRLVWRSSKQDFLEDWQYVCFRAKYATKRGWFLRLLGWWLQRRDRSDKDA